MKRCTRCKTMKSLENYYRHKQTKDGLTYWCRTCLARSNRDRMRARRAALVMDVDAICTACNFSKPASEYSRSQLVRPRPVCRSCMRDSDRERYRADPAYRERKLAARRRSNYGLDSAAFLALKMAQDGRCAICRNEEPNRELAVDHDHETEQVRALLCGSCNTAIGSMRENPELLRAAATYLELHR